MAEVETRPEITVHWTSRRFTDPELRHLLALLFERDAAAVETAEEKTPNPATPALEGGRDGP